MIEERKNNVRIKQLQEILGTEETDLNRLEILNRKHQKKLQKQAQKEEEERRNKIETSLLGADLPKIDIGVSTEPVHNYTIYEEPEEPMETKLNILEKNKYLEKEEELEAKKKELAHFYGSNAFQLMKNLSNKVVKRYIHLGTQDLNENMHFPWIKEYKRFVEK